MITRDSMVYTPVSLSPDTDDEDTLVNEEIYNNDLAQIRALVESTGIVSGGSICPSCDMPFDKGKKRRLIDSCGHERCYSCLFLSETCPICRNSFDNGRDDSFILQDDIGNYHTGFCSSEPVSIIATEDWNDEASAINSLCGSPRPRSKLNSKNPSRSSHQGLESVTSSSMMGKVPKGKPPVLPEPIANQPRHKAHAMAQSCPTPPNQRKRFFLNTKGLKSPFTQQRFRKGASNNEQSNDNPSALSAWMIASWEGKSRWPGVVLGKIISLWSSNDGTTDHGLNLFTDPPSSLKKGNSNQLTNSTKKSKIEGLEPFNRATDDEGGSVKQPLSTKTRKSSQSDLYMRLGLLLGAGHLRPSSDVDTVDLPCPNRTSSSAARPQMLDARGHETSFSSLTSFDQQTLASTNTSPVSTLTGTSSEAEAAVALRSPIKPKGKSKQKSKKDCDSVGSLASISTSISASTSMSMSMSVSVSGLSNGSSSPLTPRKHSTNPEDESFLKNRRSCARRSGRGSVKPLDPKIKFVSHPIAQLTLKPLFFEVPAIEHDPLFAGRQWLLQEMDNIIKGTSPGALISGSPGTGKTTLILQLVEHSCFGRRREELLSAEMAECDENVIQERSQLSAFEINMQKTDEKIREIASHVVAYHFCQADNNSTCLVPDLIHSMASQLCQAPQLIAYREHLLSEPHLQGSLSQRECTVDPDLALSRGILEPVMSLRKAGKLPQVNMIILIDAICEAEYHRPDRGDTIASFLTRHAPNFPSWLKIVCTVRSQLKECAKAFPYTRICLDKTLSGPSSTNISRDLSEYINNRLTQSPVIQANVTASVNGKESSCGANQARFASHLLSLAGGSFLFAKLTLDLIESGHIVAKSASYKVLPVSLAQIFQLHFNLRFPTGSSFDKVQPLLGVCLAALYPLTLAEIFYSVNSLYTDEFVSWEEFLQRFKMLSGFLVKRLDDTYMFFHPSFREWLIRRDENESTKFLCDLRLGHAAIAFRLSRLEAPISGDKVLELGHHVLKAHVYRGVTPNWPSRDLQAWWMTSSADCVSSALCTLRNIYSPNVKVSRLLLLAGASPNHTTEYLGNAPVLCMYAHEGSVEMISLLLEFGANVELTNSQGCTALSLAASRGHCDVVRLLAGAGASLGHADMAGQCPLVHAARHGRLPVVGYLLACDWVVSSPENPTEIPEISREEAAQQAVVAAASQGHEAVVEYLLDMSEVTADRADTLIGETALTIAAAHGSTATVSALLARGANPMAVNSKGLSPLMLAAREGHWGTAECLLQVCSSNSADAEENERILLEQRDAMGRTALMMAASEGHTNLIDLFLEKGALLEDIDKEGLTALSWACVRGRLVAVQCLLDRGADIGANDKTGRTPLDLAAFQGNPKLVQLLLERGAAVEHVDLNGMRPLDRAIGCRNVPVVQCFLRRGAKLGPATWAMAQGKPDVLIILLNKLLEDGNVLYRKGRLKEASHRYGYALRKFPVAPEQIQDTQCQEQSNLIIHMQTFTQLKLNFLLNLSRCKRKMNESEEAIELATEALAIRSTCHEALYSRAKVKIDLGRFEEALLDVQEALQVASIHNRQDVRVLCVLKDEIISRIEGTGMGSSKTVVDINYGGFRASVDTLTEL